VGPLQVNFGPLQVSFAPLVQTSSYATGYSILHNLAVQNNRRLNGFITVNSEKLENGE